MEHTLKRANEILGTNYPNWEILSIHQHLSEDFIREFKDKVDWNWISKYQHLSEDFIREFTDKVDWSWISMRQRLSENLYGSLPIEWIGLIFQQISTFPRISYGSSRMIYIWD